MGGAPPHGPYGAPMGPRGAHGAQGGTRGTEGGTGRPPGTGRGLRGQVRPRRLPAPVGRLRRSSQGRFFRQKTCFFEKNFDFWSKKKVHFRAIQAHHEYRRTCPVIFLNFTGVEKSNNLMSYGCLKLGRKKKWGSASPAPNVDGNPGRDPPQPLLFGSGVPRRGAFFRPK